MVDNVGHPDLLMIFGGCCATTKLWDTAQGSVANFKDWKYEKQ